MISIALYHSLFTSSYLPHDVSTVVVELDNAYSGVNVPQHASHVSRTGEDLSIVQKSTARQVAGMCAQLSSHFDGAFLGPKIVDRADVVKTSTGDEIARGGVRASHDP